MSVARVGNESKVIIRECHRVNWCVDCDDTKCLHHGKIGADCPKWKCDNENTLDCENCDFIKELYEIDHSAKMDGNTDNPHGFTADEWYRDKFGENNGK